VAGVQYIETSVEGFRDGAREGHLAPVGALDTPQARTDCFVGVSGKQRVGKLVQGDEEIQEVADSAMHAGTLPGRRDDGKGARGHP